MGSVTVSYCPELFDRWCFLGKKATAAGGFYGLNGHCILLFINSS